MPKILQSGFLFVKAQRNPLIITHSRIFVFRAHSNFIGCLQTCPKSKARSIVESGQSNWAFICYSMRHNKGKEILKIYYLRFQLIKNFAQQFFLVGLGTASLFPPSAISMQWCWRTVSLIWYGLDGQMSRTCSWRRSAEHCRSTINAILVIAIGCAEKVVGSFFWSWTHGIHSRSHFCGECL